MGELTPLIEPLSLDEAYLDLSGTERLHGIDARPNRMAQLAARIEREIGITASVGLSHNKFLAKLASDLDKPRGFAVIGRDGGQSVSARQAGRRCCAAPARPRMARLAKDGITQIGQLQDADRRELAARYGETGLWLYRLANADDTRGSIPRPR